MWRREHEELLAELCEKCKVFAWFIEEQLICYG